MKQGFDQELPNFDASPGVKEEFIGEVARGLTVMPYIQTQIWDTTIPTFDDAAKAAAVRHMDGNMEVWTLSSPLAYMCTSQKLIEDTTSRLAKYVHGLGADSVYLDTFPGKAYCWDEKHGHPLGHGGNWHTQLIRKILSRIKTEQSWTFGVMMENASEAYIDLIDAQMNWWFTEPSEFPLWPAVYGGYTVLSGAPASHCAALDDTIAFGLKIGRAFVWGNQLGRSYGSGYLKEPQQAEFVRRLVCLKAKARKFLVYGDMLRPPDWLVQVPRVSTHRWINDSVRHHLSYDAVEASLWRATDGELGMIIANFDDKSHKVAFSARRIAHKESIRASIITRDGENDWRSVKQDDTLSTEIPATDAIVLRFRK